MSPPELVSLASDHERLAKWASILLAGSIFVDLAMDSQPAGEEPLEALWDISFGKPRDDAALRLARKLATAD
jgi:hypothetical protein